MSRRFMYFIVALIAMFAASYVVTMTVGADAEPCPDGYERARISPPVKIPRFTCKKVELEETDHVEN